MFLHIMDPHIFYNAPGAFRDMWVTDPDDTLRPSSTGGKSMTWTTAVC